MQRRFSRSWLIALGLALLATTAVVPKFLRQGPNVVAKTYETAATRFATGEDPYAEPPPGADRYKYSPAFAAVIHPLLKLTAEARFALLSFLNAAAFLGALMVWARRLNLKGPWLWAALAVGLLELDVSLRYQQVNGLLAGLAWGGAAAFAARADFRAGALWALGLFLKLIPGAFLGAALWPLRPRAWAGFALTALALFVFPALWSQALPLDELHARWASVLVADFGRQELLDLRTLFAKSGYPILGSLLALIVAAATAGLFLRETRISDRQGHKVRPALWGLGAAGLMLLSTGTESPTFVFLAPAYAVLFASATAWRRAAAAFAAFFGTMIYTDLWPSALKFPWQSTYVSKTAAAFLLWILCATVLLSEHEHLADEVPTEV